MLIRGGHIRNPTTHRLAIRSIHHFNSRASGKDLGQDACEPNMLNNENGRRKIRREPSEDVTARLHSPSGRADYKNVTPFHPLHSLTLCRANCKGEVRLLDCWTSLRREDGSDDFGGPLATIGEVSAAHPDYQKAGVFPRGQEWPEVIHCRIGSDGSPGPGLAAVRGFAEEQLVMAQSIGPADERFSGARVGVRGDADSAGILGVD